MAKETEQQPTEQKSSKGEPVRTEKKEIKYKEKL